MKKYFTEFFKTKKKSNNNIIGDADSDEETKEDTESKTPLENKPEEIFKNDGLFVHDENYHSNNTKLFGLEIFFNRTCDANLDKLKKCSKIDNYAELEE